MRIAMLNGGTGGSTGTIMLECAAIARQHGHEVRTFSPRLWHKELLRPIEGHTYFGIVAENILHACISKSVGLGGLFSWIGTRQLLRMLDEFRPDLIHIHIVSTSGVCVPMLMSYIHEKHIRVVWTFHGCWEITGGCSYFTLLNCNKWQTGCKRCPRKDNVRVASAFFWKKKNKWFNSIEDLTIVTPSQWLADLVKNSYLKGHRVCMIHNGINLEVFKPTLGNFRASYETGDKKIVLSVSSYSQKRNRKSRIKGLDVVITLADRLGADYQVVVVGTDDVIDKQMPSNVISIHYTRSPSELAEIYSDADVFINPTREDNYPTVNMEAIACGTPVVTFRTGGSPESVCDRCGVVVDYDDIDAMEREVRRICETHPYSVEDCVNCAQSFDMYACFVQYLSLYEGSHTDV